MQSTFSSSNRQHFEDSEKIPAGFVPEFYQGILVKQSAQAENRFAYIM